MTWTRTSDDFPDDCWTLSDAAYRLHHEGLSWSNRKLLDCVIPLDDVRRFARCPDAVDELLARGFWRVSEDGDAYVIVHHARYQRTRDAVLNQQQANRANGSRGGRPRKGTGAAREVWETESLRNSKSEEETQRDGTGRDGKGSPTGPRTQEREAS
jgi:hypothetical protein